MTLVPITPLSSNNLTPSELGALRAFYDGLCAIGAILERGAPGQAGIAISPILYVLLRDTFGQDVLFTRLMANLWVQEVSTMKRGGDVR